MDKEGIAKRIEELIRGYREKKKSLNESKKEYEKLLKNRKVKRYVELCEIIGNSNRELLSMMQEITKLQEKFKEHDE